MDMLEKEIYVKFGSQYRENRDGLERAFETAGISSDIREAIMLGRNESNLQVMELEFGTAGLPPEMLDVRGTCSKITSLVIQQMVQQTEEPEDLIEHLKDCYRGCNSFVLGFRRDKDTNRQFRSTQDEIRSALEDLKEEGLEGHPPDYDLAAEGYQRLADLGFPEETVLYETLAGLCEALIATEGQGKVQTEE